MTCIGIKGWGKSTTVVDRQDSVIFTRKYIKNRYIANILLLTQWIIAITLH